MFMRRTLSLVLLAIVAIFTLAACGEVSHQITVTAPDASDLCGMYVSAAGEDAYGENELKDGAVLAAKTETNIPVKAAGNYDLKLVTCDGREEVVPVAVP
jgi:hypothetical protein